MRVMELGGLCFKPVPHGCGEALISLPLHSNMLDIVSHHAMIMLIMVMMMHNPYSHYGYHRYLGCFPAYGGNVPDISIDPFGYM